MKQYPDNIAENYLGNIADDLGTITGLCEEIKGQQLNAATSEELTTLKEDLRDTMTEYTLVMNNKAQECSFSMTENAEQICDTVNEMKEDFDQKLTEFKGDFNQKLNEFKAGPPVQKVEKTLRIARESWQWYLTMVFTIFTTILCLAAIFWQEGRIEQCRTSDIKYHYIMMNGGIGPVGLDSIESWYRDPRIAKRIEAEVRAYEMRVQETARALEQRDHLDQKIHELNSQKMTDTA